uniref:Coatomer subunit epsilon n=1 Tax=Caenorhabditis japonica TaxID=281687 RepID=A0A8R1DIK3_CAEJA
MADKLFSIRNFFFLGSYQSCIGEALKFSTKNEDEKNEKDAYLYRAYIAQGQAFIPLKEIPASTKSADLAAVRRYAEFRNNPAAKAKILAEVKEEVASKNVKSEISAVLSASILNEANDANKIYGLSILFSYGLELSKMFIFYISFNKNYSFRAEFLAGPVAKFALV